MNKNNRPTAAHRAPFYPAILRSWCPPPPAVPSNALQSTIACEVSSRGSWPDLTSLRMDEEALRLRGEARLRQRRDGRRSAADRPVRRHKTDRRPAVVAADEDRRLTPIERPGCSNSAARWPLAKQHGPASAGRPDAADVLRRVRDEAQAAGRLGDVLRGALETRT